MGVTVREARAASGDQEHGDEPPRHGNQGDRAPRPTASALPAALTVAVSRETGSHGSTIAHRAARKLGWTVYNQELLEYIAQEGSFRQWIADNQTPAAATCAVSRFADFIREPYWSLNPSIVDPASVVCDFGS